MSFKVSKPNKTALKGYYIMINVSGKYFPVKLQNLRKYPNTLLGSDYLCLYYDHGKDEYFFDRDPELFRFILNFYRFGTLHISEVECPGAFQDEMDFFGIPRTAMDECCVRMLENGDRFDKISSCNYRHGIELQYHDKQGKGSNKMTTKVDNNKLKKGINNTCVAQGLITKNDNYKMKTTKQQAISKRTVCSDTKNNASGGKSTKKSRQEINHFYKQKLSKKASNILKNETIQVIVNHVYGLLILASSFCNTLETIDCKDGVKCGRLYVATFFAMETFFVAVFTADYVIRFILAQNKLQFFKEVLNVVDLLAILPFYLELIFTVLVGASDVLITFRVLRVLRLMKLSRNSPRLQTLVLTLRNSFRDLLILYFISLFGILLFGSVIYYVERDGSNGEQFKSIPHSLWFTCVTMVTTGYGDVVPVTVLGKVVAALCGFCGVLIMSLPIPIMQERKANQQA